MDQRLYLTILLLTLSTGLCGAQFIPIFDWVRSFFGSYEQPPYSVIRKITTVSPLEQV